VLVASVMTFFGSRCPFFCCQKLGKVKKKLWTRLAVRSNFWVWVPYISLSSSLSGARTQQRMSWVYAQIFEAPLIFCNNNPWCLSPRSTLRKKLFVRPDIMDKKRNYGNYLLQRGLTCFWAF
jgi:hypothetical protein